MPLKTVTNFPYMKIAWTCMEILAISCLTLKRAIQTTVTGEFIDLSLGECQRLPCAMGAERKGIFLKLRSDQGPPCSPPLLQVPDDNSFSESTDQGTDDAFSLNCFMKPSVTNRVWSCCG